jgi:GT2 family glycosyltransferase
MLLNRQLTPQASNILVVVVLYKCSLSESRSLRSLLEILNANPDLAGSFSIIIYDNSPHRHNSEVAANVQVGYKHNAANPGLATAYNFALAEAEAGHYEWLLLFDQDTSPTLSFLEELVTCANNLGMVQNVGSVVPKLLIDGKIYSPAAHFVDQIRHQYRRSNHAVGHEIVGVRQERLSAYNSGAMLRVSAVRAIGGFPEDFWLDFLDHATFHALSVHGYFTYVMQSEIQHDASQRTVGDVPLWRQRNLLFAQILFVKQTGNFVDRLLYRIFLLRCSVSLWRHYPDKRLWKEAAWLALRLESRAEKSPDKEATTSDD